MYINKSLKEYGEQVSSNSSMPGGGSVAGLVSSLGGALTLMVMSLTQDKKAFKELDKSIQTDMLEKSIKTYDLYSLIANCSAIVDLPTRLAPSSNTAYLSAYFSFQFNNSLYTFLLKYIDFPPEFPFGYHLKCISSRLL